MKIHKVTNAMMINNTSTICCNSLHILQSIFQLSLDLWIWLTNSRKSFPQLRKFLLLGSPTLQSLYFPPVKMRPWFLTILTRASIFFSTVMFAARVDNVHRLFNTALFCDCSIFQVSAFYPPPFRCFVVFPPTMPEVAFVTAFSFTIQTCDGWYR